MNEKLEERVHALVRGECSATEFLDELPALCDAAPDAAWDALSVIDQYHRRGKLSAELFETLRQRIERHALGVPDAALMTETATKRASAWPRPAGRRTVAAIGRRSGERKQLAEDIRVLRLELLSTRTKLQRYRKRISVLAEYGRRTRAALRSAQRELSAARRQPREPRLKLAAWSRMLQQRVNWARWRLRARRWSIRPSQIAVVAALLLGVGATRALQELPAHRAPPPPAPAPAPPLPETIVEPGEISLSATRYLVLPGRRSVEIEVQRIGGAAGDVSFRWWTQGSGARPGRDYVSVSSKLAHVPDGVDTLRLKVPILTNPSRKHTELFYVAIEKPGGGASLGSIRRATVFIVPP
jgi:Calx-beta domain